MDVIPFLMFTGAAEDAMLLYAATFPDAEVVRLDRFSAHEAGPAGGVKVGLVRIGTSLVRCFDSADVHDFGFTPAVSLFVDCDTADQVDAIAEALGSGGQVFMPVGEYPFAERFAWLADRFGVSWQLNVVGAV